MSSIVGIYGRKEATQYIDKLNKILTHFDANNYTYETYKAKDNICVLSNIGTKLNNKDVSKLTIDKSSNSVLVLDGEVFGIEKLKEEFNNDNIPELLLSAYHHYGWDFLLQIKGWFNIIFYDAPKRTLWLITDRFGYKLLYYTQLKDTFIFASEIKGILAHPHFQRELNPAAISDYIFFNYTLGDRTSIKNIYRLPPAACWRWDGKSLIKKEYWSIKNLISLPQISLKRTLEEGHILFKKIVNELTDDIDEKYALTLTGGFDGRTILAVLPPEKSNNFYTFTFGIKDNIDTIIARRAAKRVNYTHLEIELGEEFHKNFDELVHTTSWLTEGKTGALRAHYIYTFQKMRQYANIFLTGIGGSEFLRPLHNIGDMHHINLKPLLLASNIEEALEKLLSDIKPPEFFNPDFLIDYKEHIRTSIYNTLINPYKGLTQGERFLCFNIREVVRKYFEPEMMIENTTGTLRPPYLDYEFLEFITKTPFSSRFAPLFADSPITRRKAHLFYSHILAKESPKLAWTNTDRGYPPIFNVLPFGLGYLFIAPLYIIQHILFPHFPKIYKRDIAMDLWLPKWAEKTLAAPETSKRGLYNLPALRKAINEQLAGNGEGWREIAKTLSFEVWLEELDKRIS